MIKNFFKKLTGLDKIEAEAAIAMHNKIEAEKQAEIALNEAKQAEIQAKLAKMTPKDRASAKGEPWVDVLNTHVNKENIRNGFFELDWNTIFIDELKKAGFGFDGDPEEEIVDRWFRDLVV